MITKVLHYLKTIARKEMVTTKSSRFSKDDKIRGLLRRSTKEAKATMRQNTASLKVAMET